MSIEIDPLRYISVKNIHEQNKQCPYKRKFGEFCGHHKNNKCIKRFDQILISNEKVVEVQEKKTYTLNNDTIINLDYLLSNSFKNIKVCSLRKYAKSNDLFINSSKLSKRFLLDEIIKHLQNIEYFKINIDKVIKIQSLFRGRKIRESFGPGFLNRNLVNNEYDLLTCDSIKAIPYKNFISIKDDDNFIYAFDILTLKELFNYNNENPYNKKKFSKNNLRIIISKIKNFKKNKKKTEIILTKEQEFKQRVLKIFTTIDELGNYTDPAWFSNLNLSYLKKYHFYLQDIWYWSFQASVSDKKRIYPPNGTPFKTNQSIINIISNQDELFNIILNDLEIIISKEHNKVTRNDEDRKMGCWIILSALVNVCPEAAESLPHLYQQFENWSPLV